MADDLQAGAAEPTTPETGDTPAEKPAKKTAAKKATAKKTTAKKATTKKAAAKKTAVEAPAGDEPLDLDADPAAAEAAVATFLASSEVLVQRMTKKGLREFDSRAAVVSLVAAPRDAGARLDLVLRHGVPAVRPDDVLAGLRATTGLDAGRAPLLTRVAQGPLAEDGTIGDPLSARS